MADSLGVEEVHPSSRGPCVGNSWVEAWQARIERFRILRRRLFVLCVLLLLLYYH